MRPVEDVLINSVSEGFEDFAVANQMKIGQLDFKFISTGESGYGLADIMNN